MNTGHGDAARIQRESRFWDDQLQPLEHYVEAYRCELEPYEAMLIDALEPLEGVSILDFACGAGVLSARLAARGANVLGIDIAPATIERAKELCDAVGVNAEVRCLDLEREHADLGRFDRLTGSHALHHVDVGRLAPLLASCLEPEGYGAFLESMFTNPLFRFGRAFLIGRFGIPRYGSEDEHPLGRRELNQLRSAFGEVELRLGQMHFLRLFDRQVSHYERPRLTKMAGAIDDFLARSPRLHWLSYHRVIVVRRPIPD